MIHFIDVVVAGVSNYMSAASDVAVSCLQRAIMTFKDNDKFTMKLAKIILPLVLILPKVPFLYDLSFAVFPGFWSVLDHSLSW